MGRSNQGANPSTTTIIYRGPLRTNQAALIVADLVTDFALSSNGSGTIAVNFGDYPNNATDWAQYTATYAEYRVLSMTCRFTPNTEGATVSTVAYAPIYVVWDTDQTAVNTVLTSYADASNFASLQIHSINMPFQISHRMSTVDEATFAPTTSSVIDYAFKYFATGLTNSTSYGRVTIIYHCQFRGRK